MIASPQDPMKCCNPKCDWKGMREQSVHYSNDPYQTDFCPECDWIVIPDPPQDQLSE